MQQPAPLMQLKQLFQIFSMQQWLCQRSHVLPEHQQQPSSWKRPQIFLTRNTTMLTQLVQSVTDGPGWSGSGSRTEDFKDLFLLFFSLLMLPQLLITGDFHLICIGDFCIFIFYPIVTMLKIDTFTYHPISEFLLPFKPLDFQKWNYLCRIDKVGLFIKWKVMKRPNPSRMSLWSPPGDRTLAREQ